ncbi:MAG: DUF389 domain-containing protein [Actinomycetota bacterium]
MNAPGTGAGYRLALPLRHWLAHSLGISAQSREGIYRDITSAATLLDAMYWLQIFFAAGIATLGLVLNSPAVIIGAMLISPLMGPILSGGLALSAGDMVLGIRAAANLLLSCALSFATAAFLIWLLPFKEVTAEIAARTQPNTLDLAIALFSGAIGSFSVCKQSRGMVTSIPGVAIAVALMPPLCVIGFGAGVAASLNGSEGWRIARGGALLFLTNLVAITFTAMLVFALLEVNAREVRLRVRRWLLEDPETAWVRAMLAGMPALVRFRWFRSLPARIMFALAGLAILAIPLSTSFIQLKREIARKHEENQVLQAMTRMCERELTGSPPGPRCYVGQLALMQQRDRTVVSLRLFTQKPYSEDERNRKFQEIAALLHRPADALTINMVEVPTASGDLAMRRAQEQSKAPAPVLTVPQLRTSFVSAVDGSLLSLQLPPSAELIDHTLAESAGEPLRVIVYYLAERPIHEDAQALLQAQIRERLSDPAAVAEFRIVPLSVGPIRLPLGGRLRLTAQQSGLIDKAGSALRQHSSLMLSVNVDQARTERQERLQEYHATIARYLAQKWQVQQDRVQFSAAKNQRRTTVIHLAILRHAANGGALLPASAPAQK